MRRRGPGVDPASGARTLPPAVEVNRVRRLSPTRRSNVRRPPFDAPSKTLRTATEPEFSTAFDPLPDLEGYFAHLTKSRRQPRGIVSVACPLSVASRVFDSATRVRPRNPTCRWPKVPDRKTGLGTHVTSVFATGYDSPSGIGHSGNSWVLVRSALPPAPVPHRRQIGGRRTGQCSGRSSRCGLHRAPQATRSGASPEDEGHSDE